MSARNAFTFLLIVTLLLFSVVFGYQAAYAQKRIHRLLVVDSQKGNPYDEVRAGLLKALADHGYVEGDNLEVTLRVLGNDVQEGERILKEEAKNPPDAIFVGGTIATLAAKNALYGDMRNKIVFGSPTDPVGLGVIDNFESRPKANFTGVCYPVPVKARFRFIKQLLPQAKTLGLIYADMSQSHSYNRWISDLLANDPEFGDLKVEFRAVPLVTGEAGDKVMAQDAIKHIEELNAKVDAFIKPCDQMGTRRHLSEVMHKNATKPLIGLVQDDVMGNWGATAVMYPSHDSIGKQTARMIAALFQGKAVSDIIPEWPKSYGLAFDLHKARKFGFNVPIGLLQAAGENIVK